MTFPRYRYRGARTLVRLHDRHLRSFVETWEAADRAAVTLPASEDPDYASRDALLRHVLMAPRNYLLWICTALDLPDPGIREAPPVAAIRAERAAYLDHLLNCWRSPLADMEEERSFRPAHPTPWGMDVNVESMLQHAVMHPIRHAFQLEQLLAGGD